MKIVAALCFLLALNLATFAQSLPSIDCSVNGLRTKVSEGSDAYKNRKFKDAEQLLQDAVSCDPKGETPEGRSAWIFLARTFHSEYIGNRRDTSKADEAVRTYKKALDIDPNDQASFKAIASLLENLERTDDWLTWVTERSSNELIKPQYRADALVSLASEKNTCANDAVETRELETGRKCINDGISLIDQALRLEDPAGVGNMMKMNIALATDDELKNTEDVLRVFEVARSYKASLLNQAMELAKTEARSADRARLKNEAAAAKNSFLALNELVKAIQRELDKRSVDRANN